MALIKGPLLHFLLIGAVYALRVATDYWKQVEWPTMVK